MKFFPIVERELRVAARRWSTYWTRTGVAGLVVLASAWIVLAGIDQTPTAVAQILFFAVTSGAMLYCLLIGVRATSDCLSEEKREGTLGLLFLTDLKGYDVVAGKLVANSLNGLYGLLAILPVVALALLMGGLTGTQVGCAAIALVNAMFLSVSAGMFASACCRRAQMARSLTFVILFVLVIGIPAVSWWRTAQGLSHHLTELNRCSPIYSFVVGQDFSFVSKRDLRAFGWSVGVVHALGWGFLLLACLIAPQSWQDRPAGARRLRWSERWKLWTHGNTFERAAFRAQLLDRNAFFWLAARERLKPLWVWLVLGLVGGGWVWGYSEFKRDWFNEGVFIATAFAVNSMLKNWLASEAVRLLTEERRAGTLELLLVTPISIPEILHGQALALRRQFAGPVVAALVVEAVMLFAMLQRDYAGRESPGLVTWLGGGMIMLVTDMVALYWVGMWMGLASKNPKRALSDTVGRVLALPWVVFFVGLLGVALLAARGGGSDMKWEAVPLIWFALGLGVDVGFVYWARNKLLTEFREAATRRYQQPTSWWKRLLGSKGSGAESAAGE